MKTPLQTIMTSATRVDILQALARSDKPMYVREIMAETQIESINGVSRELAMLESINVLKKEHVGNRHYYSFADTREARATKDFVTNF